MRQIIAVTLIVVGGGWALLGVGNVLYNAVTMQNASDTMLGMMVIMSGAVYVFPGLVLAGIGALAWRGKEERES